jgi:hypothetical protein
LFDYWNYRSKSRSKFIHFWLLDVNNKWWLLDRFFFYISWHESTGTIRKQRESWVGLLNHSNRGLVSRWCNKRFGLDNLKIWLIMRKLIRHRTQHTWPLLALWFSIFLIALSLRFSFRNNDSRTRIEIFKECRLVKHLIENTRHSVRRVSLELLCTKNLLNVEWRNGMLIHLVLIVFDQP